jgi:splicing factor 45
LLTLFSSSAALRFQPPKRTQLGAQKPKPKFAFAKAVAQANAAKPDNSDAAPKKRTLAEWATRNEDDEFLEDEMERRKEENKQKRKKKKKKVVEAPVPQNWDDVYDPMRPNSYEEYMKSEERIDEIREWKDRLYAHRSARKRRGSDMSSEYDGGQRQNSMIMTTL